MALKRRMVSWLTALCCHCSRDDSVLIATMALIVVADIFVPRLLWSPHGHSQSKKDWTTLKDLPSSAAPLRWELMGRSLKMIKKPTQDADTC